MTIVIAGLAYILVSSGKRIVHRRR